MEVKLRRVYDPPEPGDGLRVLVDRLWPRGLSRSRAAVHRWLPEVAPSPELRRWYRHDPQQFAEFAQRYREELHQPGPQAQALAELVALAESGHLTLLVAARDVEHSNGAVLAEVIAARVGAGRPGRSAAGPVESGPEGRKGPSGDG